MPQVKRVPSLGFCGVISRILGKLLLLLFLQVFADTIVKLVFFRMLHITTSCLAKGAQMVYTAFYKSFFL